MGTVISKDGTSIAYSKIGNGAALILVDGALCYRESGPNSALAAALAENFTVYTYDRRGRGESGDTLPYAIEREIEDLEALIQAAGGTAYLYGISSGAGLALEAANRGLPIQKLAIYEAPFIIDDSRKPIPENYLQKMEDFLAQGKRGDVVKFFMTKGIGLPSIFVILMQFMPAWSGMKAIAHTLPYDVRFVQDYECGKAFPANAWSKISVPKIVIDGDKSPSWMRNAMKALAEVLKAQYRSLAGQTHIVEARALAPVLSEFFKS